MYIVESGEFELVKGQGPLERQLSVLGPGDFFGEAAVLDRAPYGYSARATKEGRLLPIPVPTFELLLKRHPEVTLRILRKMAASLRSIEEEAQRAHAAAAGPLSAAKPHLQPVAVGGGSAKPPAKPTASAPPRPALLLHEADGRSFELGQALNQLGRFDPVSGYRPEVDLGKLDRQRSLSRRHANIRFDDGRWILRQEIGVVNGTWLNGRRLVPGEDYPLNDGDRFCLGAVEVKFGGAGSGSAA